MGSPAPPKWTASCPAADPGSPAQGLARLSVHRAPPSLPAATRPGAPQAAPALGNVYGFACGRGGLAERAVRPGCYRLSPLPACLSTLVGHTIHACFISATNTCTALFGTTTEEAGPCLPWAVWTLAPSAGPLTSRVQQGPPVQSGLAAAASQGLRTPLPPTRHPGSPFPLALQLARRLGQGGGLISAPGHWGQWG